MIKRITSLLMAVALVSVMTTFAFAVGRVDKIENGVFISSIGHTTGSKFDLGGAITSIDQDFKPGETINIYLDPSKFSGTDIDFTVTTGMSAKDLEDAGVSIRISGGSNSNLIQSATFKEKEINGKQVALIQMKIAENLASTASKDFDTKITIYANKIKQQDLLVSGSVKSSSVSVSAGSDYIFLGNGEIAEADDNISSIEVDAGNNISLFAKMYKGKKYYAVAHDKLKDADIDLLNKHSELDTIYYLDTDGFIGSDVNVKIKTPHTMFVYDQDGKKLGTTDDRLALISKYYLATKEVDFTDSATSSVDNPSTIEPDDNNYVEPMLGDDNEIPNTGIGVMPKVALAALVVGLAIIGILGVTGSKRKK